MSAACFIGATCGLQCPTTLRCDWVRQLTHRHSRAPFGARQTLSMDGNNARCCGGALRSRPYLAAGLLFLFFTLSGSGIRRHPGMMLSPGCPSFFSAAASPDPSCRLHCQQHVRLVRPPAVADAEVDRTGLPEQLGIFPLIRAWERCRSGRDSGRTAAAPTSWGRSRRAGCRYRPAPSSHCGRAGSRGPSRSCRSAAGRRRSSRSCPRDPASRRNFRKLAALDAPVGEIGAEVIERPRLAVAAGELRS